MRYEAVLAVLIAVTTLTACDSRAEADASSRPSSPPATAASLMAEMTALQVSGNPQQALIKARVLATTFAGTSEADSVARLIPTLEAAVEAVAAAERKRAADAAAEATARRLAEKWLYDAKADEMTSRTARSAAIQSENSVEFGFPYQGPQQAGLMLRDHPSYGRDVIFFIQRGQLLCHSYEDCTIRVRFDERPAESWSAGGPSDNSSTSIFLRNEARFIQRLRNSKVVRIQVPVYQEGNPTFEFAVGGFSYERFITGR